MADLRQASGRISIGGKGLSSDIYYIHEEAPDQCDVNALINILKCNAND